ncbi:MAG: hypothetical protein WBK19_10340 [Azonexus sp.]
MSQYLIAHIGHSTKWVEHVCWWNPDSKGYTYCINKAGLYDEAEARDICRSGLCIAVTKQVAIDISRGTPYYRRSNGELARLYDGGELVVVPNSKDAWRTLLAWRLNTDTKTENPTPIGVKARAIYLPNELVTA